MIGNARRETAVRCNSCKAKAKRCFIFALKDPVPNEWGREKKSSEDCNEHLDLENEAFD
jgi:hypothetical protein